MSMDKTEIIRQTKTEVLERFDALLKMIEDSEPVDCAEALKETN